MRKRLGPGAWGFIAFAAFGGLAWLSSAKGKSLSMAIAPEDAERLCAREKYKLENFWERARALGVEIAPAGGNRLAQALKNGRMLHLSRSEVEKWRLLGILAPSAVVKPNSLWTKDPDLHRWVQDAVRSEGIPVASLTLSGFHVLEFADDIDPTGLSLGDVPEPWRNAVSIPVNAGNSSILRAVHSRRHAVVMWELIPALGVEGNLEKIRAAFRLNQVYASSSHEVAPDVPVTWPVAVLIAGLASLAAVRVGLIVLRASRPLVRSKLPESSPVAEILCALASSLGFAALAGLAVSVLGGVPWRSGHEPVLSWGAPLALGFFALYAGEAPQWKRRLSRPLSAVRLLRFLAILALTVLLLKPDFLADVLGVRGHLLEWFEKWPGLWWLPWRWREPALGIPALLCAYFLLLKQWDCPGCDDASDPRPWLLVGLVSITGVFLTFASGGTPPGAALLQSLTALVAGCALGGCLLRIRS